MTMPVPRKIPHMPAILLIAAGVLLRFLFLGKNDLWYDEAATFYSAQATSHLSIALYYKFLKVWTDLFGASEFVFRLPSALFSIGALWIAYLLFKKMFNERLSLLVLFIMALSPFHLWYAQEARNYSLGLLLSLASSFFLYSFLEEEKKKSFLLYVFCLSLMFYTHYVSVLLFLFQYIFILSFSKKGFKEKFILAAPLLLLIPNIPFFLSHFSLIKSGFWVPPPRMASLGITLENFILGYNGTLLFYNICDVVIIASLSILLVSLIKKTAPEKKLTFCLLLSFVPISVVNIASGLYFSVYLDRLFLVFTPYYYALIAWSVEQIKQRVIKFFLIACLALPLVIADIRYFSDQMYQPNDPTHHLGTFVKKPFKPLASFLKREAGKGDHIFFGYNAPIYPLFYYSGLKNIRSLSPYFFVFDPDAVNTNSQKPFRREDKRNLYIADNFYISKDEALALVKKEGGRIFFIGGDFPRDGGLDENSRMVLEFFEANLELTGERDFDGIRLFIYANKSD